MTDAMPSLLIISAAPAEVRGSNLLLDKKFVEGMRLYAAGWEGQVGCLLAESSADQPFGEVLDPALLPFNVILHPRQKRIAATDLDNYDIILCSGDSSQYLHIAKICQEKKKLLIFTIEYIPETRQQIIMLEQHKSFIRKIKSLLHVNFHERRRRRAFALANGLQANGYPAAHYYSRINSNIFLYLDNRINAGLLATETEMATRRSHLMSGGRLRLIHSGRLEPMKGSQDLIPIARCLRDKGTDFVLDIFGSGSLEAEIRADVDRYGLQDQVKLQGVADFSTELVPYARQNSDIFLSCHRQSDPSCSYLENMGCGLAVAGYSNRMWKALAQESAAGWVAPLGKWSALADLIASTATNPTDILDRCESARSFAKAHLFEAEFTARLGHLLALASAPGPERSDRPRSCPERIA